MHRDRRSPTPHRVVRPKNTTGAENAYTERRDHLETSHDPSGSFGRSEAAREPHRIVRRREVLDRLGIGQSTLYDWMKRGEFPRPVSLGSKLVGWPDHVIDDWLASRKARGEE